MNQSNKHASIHTRTATAVLGACVVAFGGLAATGCESDEKLKAGDVRPMEINPSQTGGKVNIRPPSLRVTPG